MTMYIYYYCLARPLDGNNEIGLFADWYLLILVYLHIGKYVSN